MAYNMTNVTGADNIFEMFKAVSVQSDNLFAYILMVAIYLVVLFSLLKSNPPAESFTTASATLLVVSLMFLLAGVINIVWVVGATVLLAMSAVSLMKN